MASEHPRGLIRDLDAFIAPVDEPKFRSAQLQEIESCLLSPLGNAAPLHLWLYGPSGTGKTTSIHHILNTSVQQAGILPIYTDCKTRFTFLDMVEQILKQSSVVWEPRRTRVSHLSVLRSCLAGRKCVIALDSVDALKKADVIDLLQHLHCIPRVSLICSSSTRSLLHKLPSTIQSRLAPRQVYFPPFKDRELSIILTEVAGNSLWTPVDSSLIHHISELAKGDARRGLALLRHVIQRADEAGAVNLSVEHVKPTNFHYFNSRVEEVLEELSTHHRLLYDLVGEQGPIEARDLETRYRAACCRQGMAPVAPRTLNKYLNVLVLKRAFNRERGGTSPGWTYRVTSPLHQMK